jgi:hypothetical protein
MLQAQGLRTRIEIRVNRIPMALRRANMGQLLLKYSEDTSKATSSKPIQKSPTKAKSPAKALVEVSRASPSPQQRSAKRLRFAPFPMYILSLLTLLVMR